MSLTVADNKLIGSYHGAKLHCYKISKYVSKKIALIWASHRRNFLISQWKHENIICVRVLALIIVLHCVINSGDS
jgi:hypothetical protein